FMPLERGSFSGRLGRSRLTPSVHHYCCCYCYHHHHLIHYHRHLRTFPFPITATLPPIPPLPPLIHPEHTAGLTAATTLTVHSYILHTIFKNLIQQLF